MREGYASLTISRRFVEAAIRALPARIQENNVLGIYKMSESRELDLKLMDKTLERHASNRQAFSRDFKISVVIVVASLSESFFFDLSTLPTENGSSRIGRRHWVTLSNR